jgi:hypothetical protein
LEGHVRIVSIGSAIQLQKSTASAFAQFKAMITQCGFDRSKATYVTALSGMVIGTLSNEQLMFITYYIIDLSLSTSGGRIR